MAESERRQRVISSTPRLSPEDVANRAFATSFRGFSEPEVRSFLRRVSEDLAATRDREQELVAALDELEEQLRAPRPLDEAQLLDALGEETARLLRSAREAAEDIRTRGEEKAARVIEEAQDHAQRVRTESDELTQQRREESEARASEVIASAETRAQEVKDSVERYAEEQRLRADGESEAIVEEARHQGREMLEEAKLARERVLGDLGRRRALLQAQVEELRAGRDALIDAYRVVKRTFLDATESLAQVEARAAAGRLAPPPTGDEPEAELAGELEDGAVAADAEATAERADAEQAEAAAGLADVDSLFARIRAGQVDTTDGGEPAEGAHLEIAAVEVEVIEVTEVFVAEPEAAEVTESAEAAGAGDGDGANRGSGGGFDAWRRRRDDDLSGLAGPLVKQAKRAAQDDQNTLLDAVRRFKGRPNAEQVLPANDAMLGAWSDVLHPAIEPAYAAGVRAAGGDGSTVPDAVLRELADDFVTPLRERLTNAIDRTEDGGLTERIGARYREWKNQSLEAAAQDALAAAWSRGVFDTVAEGTLLQWIPAVEGRCADCDDNGLEPTPKGEAFPTGQVRPPAHPGCRCLLVPANAEP